MPRIRKPLLATLFADGAVHKDDYRNTVTVNALIYDGCGSTAHLKGKPVDLILSQKEATILAVDILSQTLSYLVSNKELLKRLRECVDLAGASRDEEG